MDRYQDLVDSLIDEGFLTKPRIVEAFRTTPRRDFLLPRHRMLEGINSPLPIGKGQTISQPLTVSIMLHLLDPVPGNKVLDIGYGSGWQTALIARIVCLSDHTEQDTTQKQPVSGEVHAYEIIPSIAAFGRKNIENALPPDIFSHVFLYAEDYEESFEKNAPYDKIISAAAFRTSPIHLIEQLTIGGTIVFPTEADDLRSITRKTDKKYIEDIYPGFPFVPITHG